MSVSFRKNIESNMREKHFTVLHITDLHMKIDRLYNQRLVLDAFLNDLSLQCKEHGYPEVILFTGDLVHNADDDKVYDRLFDEFIEKLLQVTNCGYSRIYFCPGNHDLQRNGIKETADSFSKFLNLQDERNSVNESYFNSEIPKIARERQRHYFDFVDFFEPDGFVCGDEIVQLYDLAPLNLSIISINTSWSGFGGIDKKSDLRKLLLPEAPIANAVGKIPQDRFVICAQHHPTSWLTETAEQCLLDTLANKVDMHLFGHVHDPRPEIVKSYNGSTFRNQSGALYSWIEDRYMGYSLLKVKSPEKHLHAVWRTYFQRRKAFGSAQDISDTGGHLYSCPQAEAYFSAEIGEAKQVELMSWCNTENRKHIEELFDQGIAEKPISELFVAPPLTRLIFSEDRSEVGSNEFIEVPFAFSEIIESNDNLIISAHSEYGKSTLLQQICSSLCGGSGKESKVTEAFIPVFLSFQDFAPGTNRVEKAIRNALPDLPAGIAIKTLLNDGLVTVCVDDVDISNSTKMKVIRDFVSEYNSNRFIFSTSRNREASYVRADFAMPVQFTNLLLGQFSRKNLRALVRNWDEPNIAEEQLLDRVISELKAINVPQTPINSTLLLDIMSSDPTFSPINRPTLIERFLEQLLQKRSLAEAQRRKFDFKNQIHYLGYLCEHMCKENTYLLIEDDLSDFTRRYLKSFGLPFDSKDIITNLIDARILSSGQSDGKVSFRFRAFLEFFTAKHISSNQEFREWVTDESRYLSYLNELEYYSGLERADTDLLNLVCERHLQHSNDLFGEKFAEFTENEDKLLIPMNLEDSIKYADDLAAQLNEPPLTETERDEILEAEIPRDSEGRQEVFRPTPKDHSEKFILSLFMYSNLVKNSELIPDAEKRRHLAPVLRSWAHVFFASFIQIPSLVKHRKLVVNGLRYVVLYPKEYSDNQVARQIAVNMPKELARLMFIFLGSEKLEMQLKHRDLDEVGEPRIIDFFRSVLYMDLKLRDWSKVPQRFTDRAAKSSYYKEAMLAKSGDVYRLGSFDDTAADNLQNHISASYAKLFSPSRKSEPDKRVRKKAALKKQRLLSVMRTKGKDED
jgi:predicted MPP superfamily phosphohydrolase